MITALRHASLQTLITDKAPPLLAAMGVAETWFHFGSFLRECTLFLAVWYIFDEAWSRLRQWMSADER